MKTSNAGGNDRILAVVLYGMPVAWLMSDGGNTKYRSGGEPAHWVHSKGDPAGTGPWPPSESPSRTATNAAR